MGYFLDSLKALVTSARQIPKKNIVDGFPEVVRARPERYRTSFALVHDEQGDQACIGCLQCERICPSQIISVKPAGKRDSPVTGKKRGYADDFSVDLAACIYCELCVQVCPTDAIVMCTSPELPVFAREDLVLTMDKLYANEKAKRVSWANGTKLMDMQAVPKPPAPPVTDAPPPAAPLQKPAEAAATPAKPPAGGTP